MVDAVALAGPSTTDCKSSWIPPRDVQDHVHSDGPLRVHMAVHLVFPSAPQSQSSQMRLYNRCLVRFRLLLSETNGHLDRAGDGRQVHAHDGTARDKQSEQDVGGIPKLRGC